MSRILYQVVERNIGLPLACVVENVAYTALAYTADELDALLISHCFAVCSSFYGHFISAAHLTLDIILQRKLRPKILL